MTSALEELIAVQEAICNRLMVVINEHGIKPTAKDRKLGKRWETAKAAYAAECTHLEIAKADLVEALERALSEADG